MPFTVEVEAKLDKASRIIMPISMAQKYHTGERLKALIGFAKQYNTTLLIADGLQKHNTKSLNKALKLGKQFLQKNAEILKDGVEIDTREKWNQYKDTATLKIVRWDMWAVIKKTELTEVHKMLEDRLADKKSETGAALVKSMKDAAKASFSAVDEQSSINYQKEENEYLLTFSDFEYMCYPHPLNHSQAEIYKQFEDTYRLPKPETQRLVDTDMEVKTSTTVGFFAGKKPITNKRHANSLPIALRTAFDLVQALMLSNEISEEHKKLFIAKFDTFKASFSTSTHTTDVNSTYQ